MTRTVPSPCRLTCSSSFGTASDSAPSPDSCLLTASGIGNGPTSLETVDSAALVSANCSVPLALVSASTEVGCAHMSKGSNPISPASSNLLCRGEKRLACFSSGAMVPAVGLIGDDPSLLSGRFRASGFEGDAGDIAARAADVTVGPAGSAGTRGLVGEAASVLCWRKRVC